jgi:hypothetical protein
MSKQTLPLQTKLYWKLEKKSVNPSFLPLHNFIYKLTKGRLALFTTITEVMYGDDQGIVLIKRREGDKFVYYWKRQVPDKKTFLDELSINIKEDDTVVDTYSNTTNQINVTLNVDNNGTDVTSNPPT